MLKPVLKKTNTREVKWSGSVHFMSPFVVRINNITASLSDIIQEIFTFPQNISVGFINDIVYIAFKAQSCSIFYFLEITEKYLY